jgi:hypothetical protein
MRTAAVPGAGRDSGRSRPKVSAVHPYEHPTFRMACEQYDLVADFIEMPECDPDRVKIPKRALTVSVPVQRMTGAPRFSWVTGCSIT